MGLKFIPPKTVGKYALYVKSNNTGNDFFKVYNGLGSLKNAFYPHVFDWRDSTRYDAKVLEMVNGEWYVLYDIPEGTMKEDLPWMKKQYMTTRYGYTRYYNEKPGWVETAEVTRARPMSVEEYVQFRIAVHDESKGNS